MQACELCHYSTEISANMEKHKKSTKHQSALKKENKGSDKSKKINEQSNSSTPQDELNLKYENDMKELKINYEREINELKLQIKDFEVQKSEQEIQIKNWIVEKERLYEVIDILVQDIKQERYKEVGKRIIQSLLASGNHEADDIDIDKLLTDDEYTHKTLDELNRKKFMKKD